MRPTFRLCEFWSAFWVETVFPLRLHCKAMGKKAFEEQIAALDALRNQPAEEQVVALRRALAGKNNFLAAKAADLIREFGMTALTSDLLSAFDRFFRDAEKTDPQCWAKNAISRALSAFEWQEPDVFLRGMRHVQMEPVWGGRSDTAGTLRATCAFALVQCRGLAETDLLAHLVDLFGDAEKTVRAEVAHAIEQVGSPSASLLLRLRATFGKEEPDVLGACYGGVLRIEGVAAIPWAARFLVAADDIAAEAALAIAGTHSVQGFEALHNQLEKVRDPWFRSVLLSAIALTRQEAAEAYLLDAVRKESLDAERAMEALLRSGLSDESLRRLQDLVSGNPRLKAALAASQRDLHR